MARQGFVQVWEPVTHVICTIYICSKGFTVWNLYLQCLVSARMSVSHIRSNLHDQPDWLDGLIDQGLTSVLATLYLSVTQDCVYMSCQQARVHLWAYSKTMVPTQKIKCPRKTTPHPGLHFKHLIHSPTKPSLTTQVNTTICAHAVNMFINYTLNSYPSSYNWNVC